MARPTLEKRPENTTPSGFVPSGSLLLDLTLGGKGWPIGKMSNLVGDKSTGKTLLAIEACANMARITKPEFIRYGEAEAAFDENYARSIGCPSGIRLSEPGELDTIEDFHKDLDAFLDTLPGGNVPGLYVLDSFDSLSSNAEMDTDIDKGSYGDGKAKLGSKLFRMLVRKIAQKNCMLLIVSQIRDKLNVTFGEKKTRSGGHALDFYASDIVWLAQVSTLKRQVMNIDRVTGVVIEAQNKKCKVGLSHRNAELILSFSYGMDDENSMLNWLKKTKADIEIDGTAYADKDVRELVAELRAAGDRHGLAGINAGLRQNVLKVWNEIESRLMPPMSKYE